MRRILRKPVLSYTSFKTRGSFATLIIISAAIIMAFTLHSPAKTTIWKLSTTKLIGIYKPLVLGNPVVQSDKSGAAISFNGINDGLVISQNPIEGWNRFTIEVLFKPDGTGPSDPRFLHFEDKDGKRGTLELRINSKKQWYMDTFLKDSKLSKGLALIDSTLLHPVDKWYWVALMYDGKRMHSYVNGVKELEGEINFPAMSSGEISLGVRLNKVNWFKGLIREVRFHPAALDTSALERL